MARSSVEVVEAPFALPGPLTHTIIRTLPSCDIANLYHPLKHSTRELLNLVTNYPTTIGYHFTNPDTGIPGSLTLKVSSEEMVDVSCDPSVGGDFITSVISNFSCARCYIPFRRWSDMLNFKNMVHDITTYFYITFTILENIEDFLTSLLCFSDVSGFAADSVVIIANDEPTYTNYSGIATALAIVLETYVPHHGVEVHLPAWRKTLPKLDLFAPSSTFFLIDDSRQEYSVYPLTQPTSFLFK